MEDEKPTRDLLDRFKTGVPSWSAGALSRWHATGEQKTPSEPLPSAFTHLSYSFQLRKKDRFRHTHIIGSTGTGKSKLLELMIRRDCQQGNGLCLIDPHGSLYHHLVGFLAHEHPDLAQRVVLFDPFGVEHGSSNDNSLPRTLLGFNPIPKPESVHDLGYEVSILTSTFLKAWGQGENDQTPRITKWLKNIFAVLICNRLSLKDAWPLVSIDRQFETLRSQWVDRVPVPFVRDQFHKLWSLPPAKQENILEGAENRIDTFLSSDLVSSILSEQHHSVDLESILQEGKILLVNLSGRMEQGHRRLLGTMLVNSLFRIARYRDPHDPDLSPFHLYIDEFGQFITHDIAYALEECRKYRLFLTLAHQHLAQLKKEDEYLYASVLTNCKNKIVFGGLNIEDAAVMRDELTTGFLDLKRIKDVVYTTKIRSHEERRAVVSKNWNEGLRFNYAETEGSSRTWSEQESTTSSISTSRGGSESDSRSIGWSDSHGSSRSEQEGTGQSRGDQRSSSLGMAYGPDGQNRGRSEGYNRGSSDTRSSHRGKAWSDTHQYAESGNQTHSQTDSWNEQRGESATNGTGFSESETESASRGINLSVGHGGSISQVPYDRKEEYQELSSRTFWSLQELQYLTLAALKNQDVAEVFVKLGGQDPYRVQVPHVKEVKRTTDSPRLEASFRKTVIDSHPDWYFDYEVPNFSSGVQSDSLSDRDQSSAPGEHDDFF